MLTTKRVRFRILYLLYIQVKYFGEQFVKNRLLNNTIRDNQENNALRAAVHLFAFWYEVD